MRPRQQRAIALAAGAAFTLFMARGPALAAAPINDEIDSATVVAALPFTDTIDVTEATTAPTDPQGWCFGEFGYTVFYRIPAGTFSGLPLEVDTFESDYDTVLALLVPSGWGYYVDMCSDDENGTLQSAFTISTSEIADTILMVGAKAGTEPGMLTLRIQVPPPPANDDIANSEPVTALPYQHSVDARSATAATDDPVPECFTAYGSVWYEMTLAAAETVYIESPGMESSLFGVAVFTGDPGSLTEVLCVGAWSWGPRSFSAEPGTTYRFMVALTSPWGGSLTFRLSPAFAAGLDLTSVRVTAKIGEAIASGTATCSADSRFMISVRLTQQAGRYTVQGSGYVEVECTPAGTTWTTSAIIGDSGPFKGGPAVVTVNYFAEGGGQYVEDTWEQPTKVRGG